MVPWTAGKNSDFKSFSCSLYNFISRFVFQIVYVKPQLPNLIFLDSKNKNTIRNFCKNLLHIQ